MIDILIYTQKIKIKLMRLLKSHTVMKKKLKKIWMN
ncbi:hypothetical protein [Staphylococcus phage vB_SauM-V1SA15]|nr:hypothetical protein [Staphylococcus phage vB_SauM-V1SA15]